MRQARHEPILYGKRGRSEDDGEGPGRLLRRQRRGRPRRDDDVDSSADQLRGEPRQPLILARRPTVLDDEILPLDVAEFAEPSQEILAAVRWAGGQREEADPPDFPRLRLT